MHQTNTVNPEEIKIPEFTKYNFKKGNKAEMEEALQNTNWEEAVVDETKVESFNEKFVNTITEAIKRIKVPMYVAEKKKQQKHEKQIEKLMKKSNNINKQITKQYIRHQDKDHKIRELEELNGRVQTK